MRLGGACFIAWDCLANGAEFVHAGHFQKRNNEAEGQK